VADCVAGMPLAGRTGTAVGATAAIRYVGGPWVKMPTVVSNE
jgi:hypothetical protein